MKIQKIAKFCTLVLAICVLSPISANGYTTKLDNGYVWSALPEALTGYGFGGGLAVSADGQIVYVGGTQIRFSQDGGKTWVNRSGSIDKIQSPAMATSASGRYVVSVTNQERTWVSSDYGVNWTAALPTGQWQRVSMSSSGRYIAVTNTGGFLYVSSDFGVSFTKVSVANAIEGKDVMTDVAMSGDGSRIIVSTNAIIGKVFISNNYGYNFSEVSASKLGAANWNSVDISGDGATLIAAVNRDNLFVSHDGGVTWNQSRPTIIGNVAGVLSSAISYDGSKIVVGLFGYVVISTDSGVTWNTRPGAPNLSFYTVALSQDGFIIYGNGGGTTMYKSNPSQVWQDAGTVTLLLPECGDFSGSLTSIAASSVKLEVDTMSAAANSDASTYYYFTETDTALWGASYNYGQSRDTVCEYSDLSGSVIITRGRFISSSTAHSETTTNTLDFIQYVGNTKSAYGNGGNYKGSSCGNLTNAHSANVTQSCGPGILANYDLLTQSGMVDWRDQSQTNGVQGVQSGNAYVVVKIKKSAISGAPSGTTFAATETYTLTSV